MTGAPVTPGGAGLTRRGVTASLAALPLALSACGRDVPADPAKDAAWADILAAARGQTVTWTAWAGDQKINAFIGWVGAQTAARFGVTVRHAKIDDTAVMVQQMLADKTAGRTRGGRTDLVWINGENFALARENGLLWGPFAERLPGFGLVDAEGKPATVTDFTLPTLGYESPWGIGQLTFFHDSARLPAPPRTTDALLAFAVDNPGRFAYPAPGDFTGTTFVKQVLMAVMTAPRDVLYEPADEAGFDAVTAPLWDALDAFHPHLWRSGRAFPPNFPALRRLLSDREIDLAFAFNPAEAANAVSQGLLPATMRAYVPDDGTIQNAHFVAIPFNASAKAGAMVVADFLLSPEAQLEKANPDVWGDPTVLDVARLTGAQQAAFAALPTASALPPPEDLGRGIAEPHPSWHLGLISAWRERYAA